MPSRVTKCFDDAKIVGNHTEASIECDGGAIKRGRSRVADAWRGIEAKGLRSNLGSLVSNRCNDCERLTVEERLTAQGADCGPEIAHGRWSLDQHLDAGIVTEDIEGESAGDDDNSGARDSLS
jgi:hypothetical protein